MNPGVPASGGTGRKQGTNPFLPSFEYTPDGEPHVFGGRLYLYGSHDRFRGADYCLNDYVCYSASVYDLANWRCEGVIYRRQQDPRNGKTGENAFCSKPGRFAHAVRTPGDLNPPGLHALWAPDVVCGPDGRYYLFYCLDYLPQVAVAVCDTPAGQYEYLGLVRHANGIPLGEQPGDPVQFDPGVFMDTDGRIYLYSGQAPREPAQADGRKYSQVMRLERDMLTLASPPRKLLPSVTESAGTGFEGHEFFEASSIRRIGKKYYLVYSSVNSHELCYAVSDAPDGGFCFGGTLVDIGDVYLNGRREEDAVNCLGNTHGGMECVNGQWYVFYHRQTDRTNYSRQACAEKIFLQPDGSILQAEVTSCGLNAGALRGEGRYPASVCCCLQSKTGAVLSHSLAMRDEYPYLTQDIADVDPWDLSADAEQVQYVANLKDGAAAGYKYFSFSGVRALTVELRGMAEGCFSVYTSLSGTPCGEAAVALADPDRWVSVPVRAAIPDGIHSVYFRYSGVGAVDFRSFSFHVL